MNKRLLTSLFTFFAITCLYAQQPDPVAIRINGEPVYKSELLEAFHKSNELRPSGNKESINDFVQSYIDYRMNLAEARAQQLDTLKSYQTDLSTARVQMSRKYTDNERLIEDYGKEIYNRMLQDVEISHVLIPFEEGIVLPSDTLEVYNKALAIRDKMLANNLTGDEYKQRGSQWTSIAIDNEQRNGYIGWINPFMFSAKIEEAAYKLAPKEVSMPIRTSKGYHVVQVLNKRPAAGTTEIEQVVFGFPTIPPLQHQIDSVSKIAWSEYRDIQSPEDFQWLCDEFSLAHQTGDKGCYWGKVNLESMNPSSFTYAALNLQKPGDISEPVITDYGVHIMRLLRKIPVPDYDLIKDELQKKIAARGRMPLFSEVLRREMFSKVDLHINNKAYRQLTGIADRISPKDSTFQTYIENKNENLFTIDDSVKVSVAEFIDYLEFRQRQMKPAADPSYNMNRIVDAFDHTLTSDILKEYLEAYLFNYVSSYYYRTLPQREPEYKKHLDEFSDGLLLFAVKNKNIWDKSKTDKEGLKECFERNRSRYKLESEKYKGILLFARNQSALAATESLARDNMDTETFMQQLKATINKDTLTVLAEPGLWVQGENAFVDNKVFAAKEPESRRRFPYFAVVGKFISAPEDYTDVRNQVEVDYVAEQERKWDAYLKDKYKVEIDKAVLKTIK